MELSAEHTARQTQLCHFYAGHYAQAVITIENQKKQLIDYKHKANYWEAQFKQIQSREITKDQEIAELKAKLKKREHQLFGSKSEKTTSKSESKKPDFDGQTRKRGQQKNNFAPKRRDYSHLPSTEETIDLLEKDKCCPCCQKPYIVLANTEDSEVVEVINVQAYKRKIHRKKYKSTCQCPNTQKIITSPMPDKLIPRTRFGISIWAYLLVQKYHYQRPQNNTLKALKDNGLDLSAATITDGYKVLMSNYLAPIYDFIQARSLIANHWHADETGWKVFEKLDGKANNRWFLWIFKNTETVLFKIASSRSSKVLLDHFPEEANGTLNVDRYSAYKVIAKSGLFVLAFCWAHVRRDFLDYARAYPHQEEWSLCWVNRIGNLYKINNERIKHRGGSKEFLELDKQLKLSVTGFKNQIESDNKNEKLLPSAKKLIKSLNNHWEGLTVFVKNPEIPMDNNKAENGLRKPVVGRKGYYGSGSIWSSELTAILFTIFATLECWNVNPQTWLLVYFHECAMYGTSPPTIEKYLPWNMTEEQLKQLSKPPAHENYN